MAEKYFDSQQEDEDIIVVVRRHIISILDNFALAGFFYFVGLLGIFVVPAFLPVLVKGFSYNIYVLVISLIFVFATTYVFSAWVMHYLTVCILTNEHFVDITQTSLFSRKISTLTLDKIQDTSAFQNGMMHTLLNLGTVEVQTAGEAPNFVIPNVPDPNQVSQKIMEVEEEFAKRRGLRSATPIVPDVDEVNQASAQSPAIEYPGSDSTNNLN